MTVDREDLDVSSTDTPAVTAHLEETWADLEVDGQTETIRADTEEEVRHEVLRRTMEIAVQTGEDTHLTATDSDGEWHLVVSPDGGISETGVSHGTHGSPDDTAPPAAPEAVSPPPTPVPAPAPSIADDQLAADFLPFYIPPPPGAAIETVIDDSIDEETVLRDDIVRPAPAAVISDAEPVEVRGSELPLDDTPPAVTAQAQNSVPPQVPVLEQEPTAAPAPTAPPHEQAMPTLADFRATQPPAVEGPATLGWRGMLGRSSGGLISLQPSAAERRHRDSVATVTRALSGPKTICVINPKGGAHKTTASMLIAATFGLHRGGYTLAWDNNETRGTLGWRAHQTGHSRTAVDLLADLDRFADVRSATVGDLDDYVRSQAEAQFDVLASDEDAAASSMIDGEAFTRLHETLQRFYRIIVVDTGNNMRASNWEAAVAAADQLVVVSATREDTAAGAAWMVEGLAKKGHGDKLRQAVTILSAPDRTVDPTLRSRLFDHFGSLTRAVVEVPYDPALVSGSGIEMSRLAPATREAWLEATATIARGL